MSLQDNSNCKVYVDRFDDQKRVQFHSFLIGSNSILEKQNPGLKCISAAKDLPKSLTEDKHAYLKIFVPEEMQNEMKQFQEKPNIVVYTFKNQVKELNVVIGDIDKLPQEQDIIYLKQPEEIKKLPELYKYVNMNVYCDRKVHQDLVEAMKGYKGHKKVIISANKKSLLDVIKDQGVKKRTKQLRSINKITEQPKKPQKHQNAVPIKSQVQQPVQKKQYKPQTPQAISKTKQRPQQQKTQQKKEDKKYQTQPDAFNKQSHKTAAENKDSQLSAKPQQPVQKKDPLLSTKPQQKAQESKPAQKDQPKKQVVLKKRIIIGPEITEVKLDNPIQRLSQIDSSSKKPEVVKKQRRLVSMEFSQLSSRFKSVEASFSVVKAEMPAPPQKLRVAQSQFQQQKQTKTESPSEKLRSVQSQFAEVKQAKPQTQTQAQKSPEKLKSIQSQFAGVKQQKQQKSEPSHLRAAESNFQVVKQEKQDKPKEELSPPLKLRSLQSQFTIFVPSQKLNSVQASFQSVQVSRQIPNQTPADKKIESVLAQKKQDPSAILKLANKPSQKSEQQPKQPISQPQQASVVPSESKKKIQTAVKQPQKMQTKNSQPDLKKKTQISSPTKNEPKQKKQQLVIAMSSCSPALSQKLQQIFPMPVCRASTQTQLAQTELKNATSEVVAIYRQKQTPFQKLLTNHQSKKIANHKVFRIVEGEQEEDFINRMESAKAGIKKQPVVDLLLFKTSKKDDWHLPLISQHFGNKKVRTISSLAQMSNFAQLKSKECKSSLVVYEKDLKQAQSAKKQQTKLYFIAQDQRPQDAIARIKQEMDSNTRISPTLKSFKNLIFFKPRAKDQYKPFLQRAFNTHNYLESNGLEGLKNMKEINRPNHDSVVVCYQKDSSQVKELLKSKDKTLKIILQQEQPQEAAQRLAAQVKEDKSIAPVISPKRVKNLVFITNNSPDDFEQPILKTFEPNKFQKVTQDKAAGSDLLKKDVYSYVVAYDSNRENVERLALGQKKLKKFIYERESPQLFKQRMDKQLKQGKEQAPQLINQKSFINQLNRQKSNRLRVFFIGQDSRFGKLRQQIEKKYKNQIIAKNLPDDSEVSKQPDCDQNCLIIYSSAKKDKAIQMAKKNKDNKNLNVMLLNPVPYQNQRLIKEPALAMVSQQPELISDEISNYLKPFQPQKPIVMQERRKLYPSIKVCVPEQLAPSYQSLTKDEQNTFSILPYKDLQKIQFSKLAKQPSILVLQEKDKSKIKNFSKDLHLIVNCQYPSENTGLFKQPNLFMLSPNDSSANCQEIGKFKGKAQQTPLLRTVDKSFHDFKVVLFDPNKSSRIENVRSQLNKTKPEFPVKNAYMNQDLQADPPMLCVCQDTQSKFVCNRLKGQKQAFVTILSQAPSLLQEPFQKNSNILGVSPSPLFHSSLASRLSKPQQPIASQFQGKYNQVSVLLLDQTPEQIENWNQLSQKNPRLKVKAVLQSELKNQDMTKPTIFVCNNQRYPAIKSLASPNKNTHFVIHTAKPSAMAPLLKQREGSVALLSNKPQFTRSYVLNTLKEKASKKPLIREQNRRPYGFLNVFCKKSIYQEGAFKKDDRLKLRLYDDISKIEPTPPSIIIVEPKDLQSAKDKTRKKRNQNIKIMVKTPYPQDHAAAFKSSPQISIVADSLNKLEQETSEHYFKPDQIFSLTRSVKHKPWKQANVIVHDCDPSFKEQAAQLINTLQKKGLKCYQTNAQDNLAIFKQRPCIFVTHSKNIQLAKNFLEEVPVSRAMIFNQNVLDTEEEFQKNPGILAVANRNLPIYDSINQLVGLDKRPKQQSKEQRKRTKQFSETKIKERFKTYNMQNFISPDRCAYLRKNEGKLVWNRLEHQLYVRQRDMKLLKKQKVPKWKFNDPSKIYI